MSRRSGGRAARVALRAAPLAEDLRPVRPGLKGGRYKPLTDAGVQRIHHAALDALEQIGLSQAPPSGVQAMVSAGAIQGEDGRLRYPRALVEDMLAKAARDCFPEAELAVEHSLGTGYFCSLARPERSSAISRTTDGSRSPGSLPPVART